MYYPTLVQSICIPGNREPNPKSEIAILLHLPLLTRFSFPKSMDLYVQGNLITQKTLTPLGEAINDKIIHLKRQWKILIQYLFFLYSMNRKEQFVIDYPQFTPCWKLNRLFIVLNAGALVHTVHTSELPNYIRINICFHFKQAWL